MVGHRAIAAADLYGFMEILSGIGGYGARCLEFLIVTASRSGEARLATWSEIDSETNTWNIPGNRMKSGRPHRVPLSGGVLKLLEALPRIEGEDLIFPGARLSDMSMTQVMRDMGVNAVPHGFRATFSSWCASSTAYPSEVREMALPHAIGNDTVGAYQRSDLFDKRRNLMADWAKFINTAQAKGKVFPMHKAA